MPSCFFFLASWGSDLWRCKVSVKTCLLTVCPCSWCASLPTLSCSSFHWRSSTSGRVPLPWAPALLQHQREVPSISYSPSPGWWSPLPEVYLGQGSGMLRAIASTEFLGPWCAAWIPLVSRQWKCCHTLYFFTTVFNSWNVKLPKGLRAFV